MKQHHYSLSTEWTGNNGSGTSSYTTYDRSYVLRSGNKPVINGSSDPAFRGDPAKYNPEELLLASLSSCHMLWYLHLCSEAGIIVTAYVDQASGLMAETADGGGKFEQVMLNPVVTVQSASMVEPAELIHEKANRLCFIANSVNFPVVHHPTTDYRKS